MFLYICLIAITYVLLNEFLQLNFKSLKYHTKNNYYGFVQAIRSPHLSESQFPQFLFYGKIVEELLILKRKFGVKINEALREIRKSARISFKSEKEIKQELFGFYFQYTLIAGFTWIFLFRLEASLEIQFPLLVLRILATWQVFGGALFTGLFFYLKKIKINCFRDIFLSLYLFRALILSSRPITEVVKISNINNLELKKNLKVLQRQIYELVNQIKNYGKVSRDEFDQIIFEAWDSFDEEVEKFKKLLTAIKLVFILFFVFTGFLFVIFLSFKTFNL